MTDLSEAIKNNLIDHVIISNYSESLKNVELCIGIDEAGRGPVLGPMVYSAFFCIENEESKLVTMKCADSKALSIKQREEIFEKINSLGDFCGYAIKAVSPNTISTSMLRREKYNLNEISHDTAIELIDKVLNGLKLNVKSVYVDTVGDANKYQLKLQHKFPSLKVKVTPKADSLFPCVSASSICAKVVRDALLSDWVFLEKIDKTKYGSGYPGDPETCKFLSASLNKVFGFVKLIRFSWSTSAKIVNSKCVQVKWIDNFTQDVEDEDGKKPKPKKKPDIASNQKNNNSILNFFKKDTNSNKRNNSLAVTNDSQFLLNRKLKFCKVF